MLILAMTYSGSVVFLAILLCAILGKRVVSTTWVYRMLRLNLIFFVFRCQSTAVGSNID